MFPSAPRPIQAIPTTRSHVTGATIVRAGLTVRRLIRGYTGGITRKSFEVHQVVLRFGVICRQLLGNVT